VEGYELTDRGKIVLTVVLVVLLFFLPAAILIFSAVASQPPKLPDDQDSRTSAAPTASPAETPPSIIAESPPPNGGGFNPPDTSPPIGSGSGEQGSPGGQGPPSPSGSGQGSVNPTEGTLSFLFSLNSSDSLDDETVVMLDVFLGSPKNTRDSVIAVETPQLSRELSEKFVSTIIGAFTSRGITENRIAYITNQNVPLADAFEVNLFYISRRPK